MLMCDPERISKQNLLLVSYLRGPPAPGRSKNFIAEKLQGSGRPRPLTKQAPNAVRKKGDLSYAQGGAREERSSGPPCAFTGGGNKQMLAVTTAGGKSKTLAGGAAGGANDRCRWLANRQIIPAAGDEAGAFVMQWCAPSRRQHAGTTGGAMAGAAMASTGQQIASSAIAILTRIVPRFYA